MDLFTAINDNYTYTQNGAITHKSSSDACVDLFGVGAALRTQPKERIIKLVDASAKQDLYKTIQILTYLRDIRGGQGERRVYQIGMNYLKNKLNIENLIKHTVEYGSWKDVFKMFTLSEYGPYVKKYYKEHAASNYYDLMEKYMPSIGGKRNKEAEALAAYLGLSPRNYRKYLSKARSSINIVEQKMCAKKWDEIDYSKVPSRASILYSNAFQNQDNDRYREYLNSVSRGTSKLNASVLYPYEIIEKAAIDPDGKYDLFWKNLKQYNCPNENAIVVADVSGSMCWRPLGVALSLAFYLAEHNTGIFKDKFITFSEKPHFEIIEGNTLHDKIRNAVEADWCSNTNLQAIFDLILRAAIENNLPESEMIKNLYIVSDMEFDSCVSDNETNFEAIDRKYRKAGYKRPNIIFWNVDSKQNNVPVKTTDNGVALVSGCSPQIFEMALTDDLDPTKFMDTVISKYDVSSLIKEA